MGNLKLLLAEPWDAAEILALQFAAFTDQEPFWELLFPLNEDRDHAIQRFLRGWLGDQSVRYVKVVDEESGMFFFFVFVPLVLGSLANQEMRFLPLPTIFRHNLPLFHSVQTMNRSETSVF